jgi:hypothetical protein
MRSMVEGARASNGPLRLASLATSPALRGRNSDYFAAAAICDERKAGITSLAKRSRSSS